jgi:RNA polymerase sigma-70 factor (ECF subfamily)
MQEAFAAIVKSLETYDPARPLDTYVAAIAERVCISEYRRRRAAKRDAVTDPVDLHDSPDRAPKSVASDDDSQEDRLVRAESVHLLRKALDALDRECREILRMRYFDETPYREIAEALGAPANTLAVKALRCLEELKRRYRRSQRRGDPQ